MNMSQNETLEQLKQQIAALQQENTELKRKTKYGLVWEDKPETLDNKDVIPLFSKHEELSLPHVDNQPENYLIEGDNYHSLKVLQHTHREKVDVIYIDPPYNTGNTDFVYNDKYVDADDGFRHSKWLSFMDKRLRLARNLMSKDGVIFVSIDDKEFAQLKMLLDKIFGEQNFIEMFSWVKTDTPSNLSKTTRKSVEYVYCYQKQQTGKTFKGNKIIPKDNSTQPLLNEGNSISILEFPEKYVQTKIKKTHLNAGTYGNVELLTDIQIKDGIIQNAFKIKARSKWSQPYLDEQIKKGTQMFVNTIAFSPRYMKAPKESYKKPKNVIDKTTDVGTNEDAKKEIFDIFGEKLFDYPKPVSLVKYLIGFTDNPNAVVLDFFAGSGTTGHAVMELNAEDGGKRSFILCTNNEVSPEQERNYLANNTDF